MSDDFSKMIHALSFYKMISDKPRRSSGDNNDNDKPRRSSGDNNDDDKPRRSSGDNNDNDKSFGCGYLILIALLITILVTNSCTKDFMQ